MFWDRRYFPLTLIPLKMVRRKPKDSQKDGQFQLPALFLYIKSQSLRFTYLLWKDYGKYAPLIQLALHFNSTMMRLHYRFDNG